MTRPGLLFALGVTLLLGACNQDGGEPVLSEGECADNSYCEGMQACIDDTCQAVDCLVNSDCGLGKVCSADAGYACADGCEGDSDCLANETCSGGQCEASACEDVDLDCGIGQLCEEGECTVMEAFCDACDDSTPCPEGYTCNWFDKEKVSACLPDCVPSNTEDPGCPSRTICQGEGDGTGICAAGCPDLWAVGAY